MPEGIEEDFLGHSSAAIFQPTFGGNIAGVNITIQDDELVEGSEYFALKLSVPPSSFSLGVSAGPRDNATVTVVDNDQLEICFESNVYSIREDGGEMTITLRANRPAEIDYVVLVDTVQVNASGEQFAVYQWSIDL